MAESHPEQFKELMNSEMVAGMKKQIEKSLEERKTNIPIPADVEADLKTDRQTVNKVQFGKELTKAYQISKIASSNNYQAVTSVPALMTIINDFIDIDPTVTSAEVTKKLKAQYNMESIKLMPDTIFRLKHDHGLAKQEKDIDEKKRLDELARLAEIKRLQDEEAIRLAEEAKKVEEEKRVLKEKLKLQKAEEHKKQMLNMRKTRAQTKQEAKDAEERKFAEAERKRELAQHQVDDEIFETKEGKRIDFAKAKVKQVKGKRKTGRGITTKEIIKDMMKRVQVLMGEIKAGNKNKAIVSELSDLIDWLLQYKVISKPIHKKISQSMITV
jgi:hypothetical protein